MKEQRRNGFGRSGFVGPFILVGIGILFLLNNLGIIDLNFWRLASTLWPVVLIGMGLDMLIGRRSAMGSLIALIFTAILLVGGVFFVGVSPGFTPRGEVTTIRYAPGAVDEAKIRISTSTGRLMLDSHGDRDVLVEGTVRLAGNEEIVEERSVEQGKATYHLGSDGIGAVGVAGNDSVWELRINDETPTQLDINTGAGEAELHLERMRLTELNVDLGVGAATIILPRTGVFDGEISGGIGKLVVRVPESLAVRLQVDTGIGQVQTDGQFITADNNTYLSKAGTASSALATLKVSSGIGQIVIESVAGE